MSAPAALGPFFALPQALRQAGFAVAPDQTVGFVAAVGALGPRDIDDVYRAGRALFAVPPERVETYDAIFRAIFHGQTLNVGADEDAETEMLAVEPTGAAEEVEVAEAEEPSGQEATAAERLAGRAVAGLGDAEALAALGREAERRLPRRRSYRRLRARRGDRIDLRRTLKAAARADGEVMALPRTRRRTRQRRIVLLIDVSGSMRDLGDAPLRLAHALVQAADRAEAFTLGTRLTRITAALGPADRGAAMARVAAAVADIDGGTRIGEALQAFLAVPRYAGFARGALVVVLSDGLERGAPGPMAEAVARLSRLAWRLDWLTPLAADPGYRPETRALAAALPAIDRLADGSTIAAAVSHLLSRARQT